MYYTKSDINPNIQLHIDVINDIVHEIRQNPNAKILVFGLGYDSELWFKECNNTIFVEHDKKYIELNSNIPSKNVVFFAYENINVYKSITNYADENFAKSFDIPTEIMTHAPYDIIIIDGPPGYAMDKPGRLLPLYWSMRHLSKPQTIIYVDDYKRRLENMVVNHYFKDKRSILFPQRDGCLKILC